MEVKLESLIEKIKEDGILEAKKASDEIIEQAKKQAQEIIDKAKSQAQTTVKTAEDKAAKLKSNTQANLKQAHRDLMLAVKEQITGLFDKVFKSQLDETLTPEFLKELLVKIVENFKPDEELEIVVSQKDKAKLEKLAISQLKKKVKTAIEVKVSPHISKGFRIGAKGKDVHYDFTDESISQALKSFLSPAVSAMLGADNG